MAMAILTNIDLLTAEQAAIEAGCTATWIRRLLRRGDLPGCQIRGGTWLVEMKDIVALRGTLTTRAVSKRDKPQKARKNRG